MNPDKCSATISKLARVRGLLDQRLAGNDLMVAGITYDPEYDSTERLLKYGRDRGMSFDERCRLFRTIGSFSAISGALGLGVGYGPSTVNRHRIELLVLTASGEIIDFNERRKWNEVDVVEWMVELHRAETFLR